MPEFGSPRSQLAIAPGRFVEFQSEIFKDFPLITKGSIQVKLVSAVDLIRP